MSRKKGVRVDPGGDARAVLWWDRYRKGLGYLASRRYTTLFERYRDFYEGKQWPAMTAKSRSIPRPVINITSMVVRNKKSGILQVPVKVVYKSIDKALTDGYNEFADYISREMMEEQIDADVVLEGAEVGTGIWYYYWDAEARGLDGRCEGGLRVEALHAERVIFEDPTNPDEQRQAWIIIVSRVPLDAVRAQADKGVDKARIKPDGHTGDKTEKEQEGTELCTLLTCYYRMGGEVYYDKLVEGCMVQEAHALTPDMEGVLADIRAAREREEDTRGRDGAEARAANGDEPDVGEDHANAPMADDGKTPVEAEETAREADRAGSYYYPVVVWSYEKRHDSIYGLGEVERVISTQRTINQIFSVISYSILITGHPKTVVKAGALYGQVITDEPGQVLTDYFRGSERGISYLSGASPSQAGVSLAEQLIGLVRSTTGATEVMSGEAKYASMSGAAISLLQSQAQGPLDDLRSGFWRAKERGGRIKDQFFRTYYGKKTIYALTDGSTDGGAGAEEWTSKTFDMGEMTGVPVMVVCEATTGTRSSDAGDIAVLEMLYGKGEIDAVTFIRAYPSAALGNRKELLRLMEERERSESVMLAAQVEQMTAQLEAMAAEAEASGKAIEGVQLLTAAVKRLREELAVIYGESAAKIGALKEAFGQAQDDAAYFADHIAGRAGLYDPVTPEELAAVGGQVGI